MQSAFASITQLRGFRGYTVFDPRGSCVAHHLPPPYEPILMNQVLDELRTAFDAVRCLDGTGVDAFVGRFEGGCIVLRPVASHLVMLLTDPDVNIASLNVGLMVVALKLERSMSESGSGPTSQSQPSSRSEVIPSFPPKDLSSLSLSPVSERAIPADAVSVEIMTQLTSLLAVHIGPMARVVLKKQLAELGLHMQTVGASQFKDVVALVSRSIPAPDKREAFVQAARRLVQGR